jgi:hypothetical protein
LGGNAGQTLPEESLNLSNYTITYRELPGRQPQGVSITRCMVDVYRNGIYLGECRWTHLDSQQSTPFLASVRPCEMIRHPVDRLGTSLPGATFKVFVNPLVNWLWIGVCVPGWRHRAAYLKDVHNRCPAKQLLNRPPRRISGVQSRQVKKMGSITIFLYAFVDFGYPCFGAYFHPQRTMRSIVSPATIARSSTPGRLPNGSPPAMAI